MCVPILDFPSCLTNSVVGVLYSPLSEQATSKWSSPNPNVVRTIQEKWEKSKKAHKILASPELRKKYDAGRVPSAPRDPEPQQQGLPSLSPWSYEDVLARKRKYDVEKGVGEVEEEEATSDGDSM